MHITGRRTSSCLSPIIALMNTFAAMMTSRAVPSHESGHDFSRAEEAAK
jgi:hypothetical protein